MRWIVPCVMVSCLGAAGLGVAMLRHRSSQPAAPGQGTAEPPGNSPPTSGRGSESGPSTSTIDLQNIAQALGMRFVPTCGTTPDKHFPTANGTGVAFIDFDQDGWLDLCCASACTLDPPKPGVPNVLFRSREGRSIEDVSVVSNTAISGFTQGLASGDINNDGFPDLFLSCYGPDRLLVNNGDGTFQNRSDASGLSDPRWGTSAAFLDFDEDGILDLYITHYGKWDLDWHRRQFCGRQQPPERMYCSPKLLDPEDHALYRGHGDGTFEEVTERAGVLRTSKLGGRGQGVVTIDVNNDGHVDIYVANDLNDNFLFLNNGHGGFEDHTDLSGAAVNDQANVEAGMGVDAVDVDGDGLAELFVTNFYMEHNTLYRNLGNALFQDVSGFSGVAAGSVLAVGWGTALEDLDGDGLVDIFVTNGHVDDNIQRLFNRDEPYAQKPGLWRNVGRGRFEHVRAGLSSYFEADHVGRGAAFGDFDNDGDVDIVVSHKHEPPAVLRNDSRTREPAASHNWVQFRLIGTRENRDAYGAAVAVHTSAGAITRQIKGGRSYISAHDLRLTIGIGKADRIDRVEVRWPGSRQTTELRAPALNQQHTLYQPAVQ